MENTHYIYPANIVELKQGHFSDSLLTIGSCMTLTKLKDFLHNAQVADYASRGLQAILENLQWFAGSQIRNVASISGNIITASPISDLNPVLMCLV